ncbi:MAG: HD domain-containing protein [Acidobacteriota bacterium]
MTATAETLPSGLSESRPSDSFQVVVRALAFAAGKHRHQRRKDECGSPYINHPIELLDVLVTEGGVSDPAVLAAALLHDTVEDTETSSAELEAHFGEHIAGIVREVTDDRSLPKAERKRLQVEHAPHASREAQLVKLADKICNVRDILASPPAGWDAERKQTYLNWSKRVVDGVRGVHPGLEARFDSLLDRRHELEA